MKKVKITPEQIQSAAKNLAKNLKIITEDNKNIYLVGINRGGLIPLGYLSYFLDTRNTKLIDINLYKNEEYLREIERRDIDKLVQQLQFINYFTENDVVIFVDDLIDTGATFKAIDLALDKVNKNCKIIKACLFGKRTGLKVLYGESKPEGWLVFPWDEEI